MSYEEFIKKYKEMVKAQSNGLVEVTNAEAFKIYIAIVVALESYNKGVEEVLKNLFKIK